MNLQQEVQAACGQVMQEFPIPRYIGVSQQQQTFAILSELEKYLPSFQNQRLLDVGSGPLDKTAVFQKMGFECYAADDLSDPWHQRDDNVGKIKDFAGRVGIRFHHQQGNYHIPFEPETFDVVCSLAVIEHLHESPRSMLNAMGTFAKTAGLIVIVMPNAVNLRKRLSVLAGKTNYPPVDQLFYSSGQWRGHVREYTLKETVFICERNGFSVVSATTFEHLAHVKLHPPLRLLYTALGRVIPTLRSSLLVIARKPAGWTPLQKDAEKYREVSARSVAAGAG